MGPSQSKQYTFTEALTTFGYFDAVYVSRDEVPIDQAERVLRQLIGGIGGMPLTISGIKSSKMKPIVHIVPRFTIVHLHSTKDPLLRTHSLDPNVSK